MKTCTLILAFAAAVAQASYWGQGNCGLFEYECKGNWNEDHTQQEPNYCIPNKIPSVKIEGYQCDNKCPLVHISSVTVAVGQATMLSQRNLALSGQWLVPASDTRNICG